MRQSLVSCPVLNVVESGSIPHRWSQLWASFLAVFQAVRVQVVGLQVVGLRVVNVRIPAVELWRPPESWRSRVENVGHENVGQVVCSWVGGRQGVGYASAAVPTLAGLYSLT